MPTLFGRKCVVTIQALTAIPVGSSSGLRVEGLRCVFVVTKTSKKEPNTLDLKVYNYSSQSRAQLQVRGARTILEAGYQNESAIIFQGDARTIDHSRDGADWVTHVQCGDGERATQYARISQSFAPGVSIQTVGKALLDKLVVSPYNLQPGNAVAKLAALTGALTSFPNGRSLHGNVVSEFDTLTRSVGLEFSIQDGEIQLLADGEPRSTNPIELSAKSGLVGSPEHGSPEKKGGPSVLKVKSLLRAEFQPGQPVRIEAEHVKGAYKIMTVRHTGDTFGGEWYSELECLPATNTQLLLEPLV